MTRTAGAFLAMAVLATACKDRDLRRVPDAPAAALAIPPVDAGAEEENTIGGSAGGASFTHVAAAFVIESPESEATTVIYLLSKPVRCVDLSFSDWDRTITNGTLVLELKILGKVPGSFLVVSTPTPSTREAVAEWMRASADPSPVEVSSTGGWVVLDSLSSAGPAKGSFALEFGAGQLTGKFNAALCPGGHEP
jgi:hypothetical protein